ncbi:MAG TPA: citrate synthase [Nocardioidaceae bacterium]
MSDDPDRWLSTGDASAKLGVRPQTLYAYVSRGLLTPRRDGRRSYFKIDELEKLEPKSKRTVRRGRIEVAIDSAVTLLESEGRLFYRGEDVQVIAPTWSFERAAELLWSGYDSGEPKPWPVATDTDVPGRTLTDRVRNAMASLAVNAPEIDSQPQVARTIGRRVLPQLVASLPLLGKRETAARAPLARQLWVRLTELPPTADRIAALNCALIVFADHQLVRSTIAARFAASSQAPPLDAVLAAMATHSGVARHGFRTSMEEALRVGGEPPGAYDQVAYSNRDPRADALAPLVRPAASEAGWQTVALALADERPPSADLALASLTVACEMAPTAAEAIYTIARVAGLLAHVAEEYDHPSAFRPSVGYRGPVPSEYLGDDAGPF